MKALQLRRRHDLVDEADAQRVRGAVLSRRVQDLLRRRRSDEIDQLPDAFGRVAGAHPRDRQAEHRVVAADPEVAVQRPGQAAAQAIAADHRDRRLLQRREQMAHAAPRPVPRSARLSAVDRSGVERRDVAAGRERLVARAAQDDDADGIVAAEGLDHLPGRLHISSDTALSRSGWWKTSQPIAPSFSDRILPGAAASVVMLRSLLARRRSSRARVADDAMPVDLR